MEQNFFYPSFLFSITDTPIKEDILFKSITTLKSSSNPNLLSTLHWDLMNNRVACSKLDLYIYLKEHINSHFSNKELSCEVEEHLIKHNNECLIFIYNREDNSMCVKYLQHSSIPNEITSIAGPATNIIRENSTFELNELESTLNTKHKAKKRNPFSGLFNLFGSKSKKDKEIKATN